MNAHAVAYTYLPEVFALLGAISVVVYGTLRPTASDRALRLFAIAWMLATLVQARTLLVILWNFQYIPGIATFGGGLLIDRFGEAMLIIVTLAVIVILFMADDLNERYAENDHWLVGGILVMAGLADWCVQQGDLSTTVLGIVGLAIVGVTLFAGERAHEEVSDVIYRLSINRFLGVCGMVLGASMLVLTVGSTRLSVLLGVTSAHDGVLVGIGASLLVAGLSWTVLLPPLWGDIAGRSITVSPTVKSVNIVVPMIAGSTILMRLMSGAVGDPTIVVGSMFSIICGLVIVIAGCRLLVAKRLLDMEQDLLILSIATVLALIPALNAVEISIGVFTTLVEGLACIAFAYPILNAAIGRAMETCDITTIDELADLARKDRWSTVLIGGGVLLLVGVPPLIGFIPHLSLLELLTDSGAPWLGAIAALGWAAMVVVAAHVVLACMYVGEKDRGSVSWSPLSKVGGGAVALCAVAGTVATSWVSHFLQSVAVFVR